MVGSCSHTLNRFQSFHDLLLCKISLTQLLLKIPGLWLHYIESSASRKFFLPGATGSEQQVSNAVAPSNACE